MILYHYTTPQNLLLVSWSGLKPKGETITGGRPVVWLTTQETAVLREADVAHIKSCPQRLEDWRGEGREPEAGAPYWPDRTERVTVKLQRDDRRLVRYVDFLRRLGGEEYARGFEQELSPSSRGMWWVYLGKIPPRKLSPITVAQGRVGLQIQIVLHGHEGHKRLLEAMRDADPGRLVTWDLNDDEAARAALFSLCRLARPRVFDASGQCAFRLNLAIVFLASV